MRQTQRRDLPTLALYSFLAFFLSGRLSSYLTTAKLCAFDVGCTVCHVLLDRSVGRYRRYMKSLKPSAEALESLNLKDGRI